MRRVAANGIRTLAAASLILIGPAFARAQSSGQPANPEIVVTGKAVSQEEARKVAVDFVRETGVAGQQESVARYVDEVCPKIYGVTEAAATRIAKQVRTIAADVGAAIAPANCRANVAIVFTDDGREFMRDILSRQPRRLGQMSLDQRKMLAEGEVPVRWWYGFETRSKHGTRTNGSPPPGSSSDGAAPLVMPGNDETTTLPQYNSSIASTQAIRAITSSTVVVDVRRLAGRDPDAVAALATFVALAEIRLEARPPGSVLSLFEDNGTQAGLTARDQAFLEAVYKLPLDRKVNQQRNRIIGRLAEAAAAGN